MPKQTKIKELMKSVGEIIARSDDRIDEYEEYALLADAIKSQRKENKRLKKERKNAMGAYILLQDMILKEKTSILPVAEFKCAKTNKPTLGKTYLIIQEVDGKYRYAPSLLHFSLNSSPEWPYNTVAFTETDPGEIVNALNKEK